MSEPPNVTLRSDNNSEYCSVVTLRLQNNPEYYSDFRRSMKLRLNAHWLIQTYYGCE